MLGRGREKALAFIDESHQDRRAIANLDGLHRLNPNPELHTPEYKMNSLRKYARIADERLASVIKAGSRNTPEHTSSFSSSDQPYTNVGIIKPLCRQCLQPRQKRLKKCPQTSVEIMVLSLATETR